LAPVDEYVAHQNRETFLAVQIESPEAVSNADAIAAVEGVDILFLGPSDYALRAGLQSGAPDIASAQNRVAAAAKRHGKHWGQPAGTTDELTALLAQGARFLSTGSDFGAMLEQMRAASERFDTAIATIDG